MSAPDPLFRLPGLWLVLVASLAACGTGEEAADAGPTIDVEAPLEVSTENDVIEPRHRESGLSGILPDDFPGDVPLVLPASLVDYGEVDGAFYIELATSKERQTVERGLLGLLQGRDWTLLEGSSEGTRDELRFTKDNRPLRIVFREGGSGSLYRVFY